MEEISRKIAAVDLTFFDRYSSSGVAKLRAEDPSTQVKEPRKGEKSDLLTFNSGNITCQETGGTLI